MFCIIIFLLLMRLTMSTNKRDFIDRGYFICYMLFYACVCVRGVFWILILHVILSLNFSRELHVETLSYIHTRHPTNSRSFPTNYYGLVGYDRVKNYPLWLKSVSILDKPLLYPRCIPDAPTLKSRSPRPTSVLPADQSPLCTTNPDLFLMQPRSLRSI